MTTNATQHGIHNSDAAVAGGGISVIIPIWRDLEALASLVPALRSWPEVREIIVSLADANPAAIRKIQELGAACVEAEQPNRGRQLDLGAAAATGRWLLFHHGDTEIAHEHLETLAALDARDDVAGGAFYRRFDERHPRLRWLAAIERWHNRSFGALYGDQSIFVRREIFTKLGGFRGLPLMEDVDFSLRMRRAGRIVLLDPPIASSPRRHLLHGTWRTTLKNAMLLLLFRLGVPPDRLHALYYGGVASRQPPASHQPCRERSASPVPLPRTAVRMAPKAAER